jgi:hypothetical protein
MPYKPTGRPPGRPKTKEYVTLMARVDVTLADQVKRYASLHRQPISLVIRDALSLLMEEYPAEANPTGSHRLAAHEFLSDRYESPLDSLLGETDKAELEEFVSDTNKAAIAILDADAHSEREYVSDTKEGEGIVSDTKAVPAATDRAVTIARLRAMRAEGMSLKEIADQLNTESLPTLSGKGTWAKGTVGKLLHGH